MTGDKSFHLRREVTWGNIGASVMVVIGLISGYIQTANRIENLEKGQAVLVKEVIPAIKEVVTKNREFQINQREKTWARINENEKVTQSNSNQLSEVKAGVEYANKQLDRLIAHTMGAQPK